MLRSNTTSGELVSMSIQSRAGVLQASVYTAGLPHTLTTQAPQEPLKPGIGGERFLAQKTGIELPAAIQASWMVEPGDTSTLLPSTLTVIISVVQNKQEMSQN